MRKTISQRRVDVLKDVLKQLEAEKYIPQNGTYVNIPDYYNHKCSLTEGQKSAKESLLRDNPTCKVCAKGAIFLSTIRKENKVLRNQLFDSNVRENTISKLFGHKNMDNVECTFEQWDDCKEDGRTLTALGERRQRFIKRFDSSEELLKGIITNMIRNKGILTFPKR